MNLKHLTAVAAAFSLCAVSFASLAANAEVTINYNPSSDIACGDDGVSLRRNIRNTWGNDVTDIEESNVVNEYITVNFTISGLGDATSNAEANKKYDCDGTNFVAFLGGSVGGNTRHNNENGEIGDQYVNITGDGDYSVTWNLDSASDTVLCLYLQTNINYLAFGSEEEKAKKDSEREITDSGLNLTITSIKTGDAPEEESSEESKESNTESETAATTETAAGETTTAASTTTTAAATTTTTAKSSTTTTAKSNSAATTAAAPASSSDSVSNAPTGDTTGIAVIATVLTAAGAAAVVSKKKD